jgi:acetyl esterase/lipase
MISELVMAIVVGSAQSGSTTMKESSDVWSPEGGRSQVKLWSATSPSPLRPRAQESMLRITDKPVGGKPWTVIYDVSVPTVTVYKPLAPFSKTAVIVYPGGGYNLLAIDLEGSEICEWLNSVGMTAVLVKYRVPSPKVGPYRESLQALQDAQRAVSWTRSQSKELSIDPNKIGVIGFSAGGHLVAAVSTRFSKRSYPRQDAIDDHSCRPNFAVALYPGHIWNDHGTPRTSAEKRNALAINPSITVSKETPPTFIVQSQDDHIDDYRNSIGYFLALKSANVPVELHMFSSGGHAFGLRKASQPIGEWPNLVVRWLRNMKLL